jgi:hypothetical protein
MTATISVRGVPPFPSLPRILLYHARPQKEGRPLPRIPRFTTTTSSHHEQERRPLRPLTDAQTQETELSRLQGGIDGRVETESLGPCRVGRASVTDDGGGDGGGVEETIGFSSECIGGIACAVEGCKGEGEFAVVGDGETGGEDGSVCG